MKLALVHWLQPPHVNVGLFSKILKAVRADLLPYLALGPSLEVRIRHNRRHMITSTYDLHTGPNIHKIGI